MRLSKQFLYIEFKFLFWIILKFGFPWINFPGILRLIIFISNWRGKAFGELRNLRSLILGLTQRWELGRTLFFYLLFGLLRKVEEGYPFLKVPPILVGKILPIFFKFFPSYSGYKVTKLKSITFFPFQWSIWNKRQKVTFDNFLLISLFAVIILAFNSFYLNYQIDYIF